MLEATGMRMVGLPLFPFVGVLSACFLGGSNLRFRGMHFPILQVVRIRFLSLYSNSDFLSRAGS